MINWKIYTLSIQFIFLFLQVHSQDRHIDTIKSYTGIIISAGPDGFFLNKNRIPKSRYDYYKKVLDKIETCTPCWVKTYQIGEILDSEGFYYMDCPAGEFISYYENGNTKEKGSYKTNPTNNWKNWYERGGCRKEGVWKYFDEYGRLIKEEKYTDGKLNQ